MKCVQEVMRYPLDLQGRAFYATCGELPDSPLHREPYAPVPIVLESGLKLWIAGHHSHAYVALAVES